MKLTVGAKILLGFALALIIQLVVAVVSYRTTTRLIDNSGDVTQTYLILGELEQLLSFLKDAETGQRGYLLTQKRTYLDPYTKSLPAIEDSLKEVNRLTNKNSDQQKRVVDLREQVELKLKELAKTIELNDDPAQGPSKALELVKGDSGKDVMDKIRKIMGAMQDEEKRLLAQRAKQAAEDASLAANTILFGTLIAFVFVAVAGILIQRSITVPLRGFMHFVERIGTGDLTQQAPPGSGDEVSKLGETLNQMVAGLRDLAGQTRTATENLNASSAEILASVQQQVAGTREQAASVQEITTTVEEIGQSGNQISERAKQVAASAEATASTTTQGLQSVQIATRSMEAIREQVEAFAEHIVALSEKTQAVGEIISAVTDIAERSNLLALNAAIEAAGAGEHGNRFAVVASEMKNLADQAKESTVQVQTILGAIQKGINSSVMLTEEAVKRSEAGKEQAEKTESVIRQMADTTQESVRAFQQIIAATNQQQIGLEQVTQGMKDIRQAAGQTATASAQLEKAVVNVNALSQQLQKAAGRYKM